MLDIFLVRVWRFGVTVDWRSPSWFWRRWRGWLLSGGIHYREMHATIAGLSITLWVSR